MGKGDTFISMNYEFNLLALSTQVSGSVHEPFPVINDAPAMVEIAVEEPVEEKEKPWWEKAFNAVADTVKKAIVPLAIGALAVAAVALIVGTGGTGAVLVGAAVAAGKAFAAGLIVTAIGASVGAGVVAANEIVTGIPYSQETYNEMAQKGARYAGFVYGVFNIAKLISSINSITLPSIRIPQLEGLGGMGYGIFVSGGGIAVDAAGVIEGLKGIGVSLAAMMGGSGNGSSGSGNSNNTSVTAGKNLKDHYIRHKGLLEKITGKKYPKWKQSNNGSEFLDDIKNLIDNGKVKFEGLGTIKKGFEAMNIYRGNGVTIVIKTNGEFVTILETGQGMDLGIQIIGGN